MLVCMVLLDFIVVLMVYLFDCVDVFFIELVLKMIVLCVLV